jgi:preprotein translocase subunit YajC
VRKKGCRKEKITTKIMKKFILNYGLLLVSMLFLIIATYYDYPEFAGYKLLYNSLTNTFTLGLFIFIFIFVSIVISIMMYQTKKHFKELDSLATGEEIVFKGYEGKLVDKNKKEATITIKVPIVHISKKDKK